MRFLDSAAGLARGAAAAAAFFAGAAAGAAGFLVVSLTLAANFESGGALDGDSVDSAEMVSLAAHDALSFYVS